MFKARNDDKRKRLPMSVSEADHERLRNLAQAAQITQGDVLHILIDLCLFVVETERERGTLRPHDFQPETGYASPLESFVYWALWKSGVATDAEFREVVNLAAAYGSIPMWDRVADEALQLMDGFVRMITERRRNAACAREIFGVEALDTRVLKNGITRTAV